MALSASLSRSIDLYEAGATTPARAVAGLSASELNSVPVPGTWSIQQIVVHLWESEMAAVHRMRRVIAEESPLLIGYDESAAAKALSYEHEDLARVCRMFEDLRRQTAAALRRQPEGAFSRLGIHNHRGKVTLAEFVDLYVNHVRGHMKHLMHKRELLGKPLAIEVP